MEAKVLWLFVFVALYWAYCVFWGFRAAAGAKTPSDFFIAGRRLTFWVFALAVTAASFSGWSFLDQPGLLYRDGLQFGFAALAAIAIPLTGVLFLKRQWMLGTRYGYVTPGEMLADYFQGDLIRLLTLLVALVFAIPFLALQLLASGALVAVLTDDFVPQSAAMWALAAVLLFYVAAGGLRAVAEVGALQCLLLGFGLVAIGLIALGHIGGWDNFAEDIAALAQRPDLARWGATAEGYSSYFALPGAIALEPGLDLQPSSGGLWTGVLCLTFILALMGIQSSPAFSMWAFGSADPKPFGTQQVWVSSFCFGLILVGFVAVAGLAAHLLGANPTVTDAGLARNALLPGEVIAARPDSLVLHYIHSVAGDLPWLAGLLVVCGLAAIQSTAAALLASASGMMTRDLYKRFVNPMASYATQKLAGRLFLVLLIVPALLLADFAPGSLLTWGSIALAFGFQMWPALAAVCWLPWITRAGATLGLAAGMIAVLLTEPVGGFLAGLVGSPLPWGTWPYSIHSAAWGMLANLTVCLLVSAVTQREGDKLHQSEFHEFLRRHAAPSPGGSGLALLVSLLILAWLAFAVGPGALLGNSLFGAPDAGLEGWTFGIPSLWAWQGLAWLLGVCLIWLLAYKLALSRAPRQEVEPLIEDIGDMAPLQERE